MDNDNNQAKSKSQPKPDKIVCYSCQKQCENNKTKTLDCDHILCNKCLSISLIKAEFKDITSDSLTLNCFCGNGKYDALLTEAAEFFIGSSEQKKTCEVHGQVVECYCENCQIWLCPECKLSFHDAHMSFHETVPHPRNREHKCIQHQYPMKVYCDQCKRELCLECIGNDSAHTAFHVNISEQSEIIKEEIKGSLSKKNNDAIYAIIDKAEKDYKKNTQMVYENDKNKIEVLMRSLTMTLNNLKEVYEKEIQFANIFFQMMRYSYNNYYKAFNYEYPAYSLLNTIAGIKKEIKDITIEVKEIGVIDKMLFDIKKLNRKRFLKLNVNYKSMGKDNDKDKDNDKGKDYDTDSKNKPLTFKSCHSEFMSAMCSIGDGIYCTGSLDNSIKVFQLNKEENGFVFQREFNEHQAGIKLIANADFGKVVSVSSDNVIIIWQIASEKSLSTLNTLFNKEINDIAITNKDQLIVCGDQKVIKVINLDDGQVVKELVDHSITDTDQSLTKLLWIPNMDILVVGAEDGSLSLWNEEGEKTKRIIAHQAAVHCMLQISDDSIASGSADNTIRIISLIDFNCSFDLNDYHSNWITSLCYIANTKIFVSGSKDNTIVLWDASVSPYKYIKTLSGYKNSILFLSATEKDSLISGSCDTLIKLWKKLQ